ncbi:Uncharacterised protein g8430 [Pycnogonum litorale]
MVRNRIRKKENFGQTSAAVMKQAVKEIMEKKASLRNTAEKFAISKSTLQRYVQKAQSAHPEELDSISVAPNYSAKRVFSGAEEHDLANYLFDALKMHHGLTPSAVRELAFQFAEGNGKTYPEKGADSKKAGEDWFLGFMKRHCALSLRYPEATSLARATSFNKFFDNLQEVYDRYKFRPETSIM